MRDPRRELLVDRLLRSVSLGLGGLHTDSSSDVARPKWRLDINIVVLMMRVWRVWRWQDSDGAPEDSGELGRVIGAIFSDFASALDESVLGEIWNISVGLQLFNQLFVVGLDPPLLLQVSNDIFSITLDCKHHAKFRCGNS